MERLKRAILEKKQDEVEALLLSDPSLVRMLDAGGNSPLHHAALVGSVAIAELLIAHEADVNARDSEERETPLHHAAYQCNPALVKLLLDHGAEYDPRDTDGSTPLIYVAAHCLPQGYEDARMEVIQLLISAGADVNAMNDVGRSALMCATDDGNLAVMERLISSGADVNLQRMNGPTAMHLAMEDGKVELAECLLRYGADIDAQGYKKGQTPLHLATLWGFWKMVAFLLSRGARTDIRDSDGNTALDIAIGTGEEESIRLFADHSRMPRVGSCQ